MAEHKGRNMSLVQKLHNKILCQQFIDHASGITDELYIYISLQIEWLLDMRHGTKPMSLWHKESGFSTVDTKARLLSYTESVPCVFQHRYFPVIHILIMRFLHQASLREFVSILPIPATCAAHTGHQDMGLP
jgi:hypothetical protein